jgi:Cytochrome c554 and c-prime
MKRLLGWLTAGTVCTVLVVGGGVWGASMYYTSNFGSGCANCHEMAEFVHGAHASTHRGVNCGQCHENNLATKLRHIRAHITGNVPEAIRLRDVDALAMTASCQRCHQQEYSSWHAGPHSATYRQIFADPRQNTQRRLMDDCFRCHGMHFDGALRDLVQPTDLRGRWRIVRPGFADQPTMPCVACHWIHREGSPSTKPAERISVAGSAFDDSLAFFDRRERMHFAAAALSLPQVYDQGAPVKMSPDQRQSLCYQCHAPRLPDAGTPAAEHGWGPQAGSGDDRTPMGVHEGLSCFACHNGHGENARASCKTCHGKMSECGMDVEKMDTTYSSAASQHNIHWVRCIDCHTHGAPRAGKQSAGSGVRERRQPAVGG